MSSSKKRAERSAAREAGRQGGSERKRDVMESSPVGCQWYANMTFTSEETTSPNQIRHKFGLNAQFKFLLFNSLSVSLYWKLAWLT